MPRNGWLTGTPEERFWAKVNKTKTCWLWTGGLTKAGYGKFWGDGKDVRAHRFAYEGTVGPIPSGLILDHLCRVRHCVNPDHLEPVTVGENVRRGELNLQAKAQTHCKRGHLLAGDNLLRVSTGRRSCRECKRMHNRSDAAKRRSTTHPLEAQAEGLAK